ncbi:MAG: septum formation protein Maf [Bacteroidales bacterium]|nr:septum formation protein Maf [Bacteroidales bacterium]
MGIDDINKYRIILASKSPRRRELLKDLGLKFELAASDRPEVYPSHLKGKDIALYLAEEKANDFREKVKEGEIVITADTIVWCNGRVLDKPSGREDAHQILREISGNTHEVITAVSLLSRNRQSTFYSSTKVTFTRLTDEEIEYYIDNFKPYDKAGGYGIQEWIGLAACSFLEGSYFNVMGLPVEQLYHELQKFIHDS